MSKATFSLRVDKNPPFHEILKFEINGKEVTPMEFAMMAEACAKKLQSLGYQVKYAPTTK